MTASDNVELMRKAYAAFGSGDMETVATAFSPAIRWHEAGRSQVSGTYEGRDAVFGFFGRLMELTDGTFKLEVHDVLASEEHVVGLARLSGTRGGREFSWDEAHIWHIKDGVATEFWNAPVDSAGVDDFWG